MSLNYEPASEPLRYPLVVVCPLPIEEGTTVLRMTLEPLLGSTALYRADVLAIVLVAGTPAESWQSS